MALKAPCLNCPNRTSKCHSTCELYINFKNENDKIREERNKIKQSVQDWYEFEKNKFKRINRKR